MQRLCTLSACRSQAPPAGRVRQASVGSQLSYGHLGAYDRPCRVDTLWRAHGVVFLYGVLSYGHLGEYDDTRRVDTSGVHMVWEVWFETPRPHIISICGSQAHPVVRGTQACAVAAVVWSPRCI